MTNSIPRANLIALGRAAGYANQRIVRAESTKLAMGTRSVSAICGEIVDHRAYFTLPFGPSCAL